MEIPLVAVFAFEAHGVSFGYALVYKPLKIGTNRLISQRFLALIIDLRKVLFWYRVFLLGLGQR
jgi:hypothetical protein